MKLTNAMEAIIKLKYPNNSLPKDRYNKEMPIIDDAAENISRTYINTEFFREFINLI